jgi:hypothetical protein
LNYHGCREPALDSDAIETLGSANAPGAAFFIQSIFMLEPCLRYALIVSTLLSCQAVQAQIYKCTGADGTPVYSDQKCGPDAKRVQGITTKKRAASNSEKAAKTPPKTTQELQDLMKLCNAGDMKACTAWTRGGGPNSLRERERKAEAACEGGSLPDCEIRYCSDGASEECRQRVLQSAKLSGDAWYVREAAQQQDDGSTSYKVRCVQKDVMETRDATITCAAQAGPRRCYAVKPEAGFARLDQAASGYCSVKLRTQAPE